MSAHSTLASTPSTAFPQPPIETLMETVTRVYREHFPDTCEMESAECRFPCGKPALVTDLSTEQSLCLGCFRG